MIGSVLFVDDEENILISIHRFMDEWLQERGFIMETANSVDQALDMIQTNPERYYVVVSDLKMPMRLGTELLAQVNVRWPEISTILLTGFAEMDEIKKAIKSGIVSFMQKPWDQDIVISEVGKAIELSNLRRNNRRIMQILVKEAQWSRKIHQALLMDQAAWKELPHCGMAYRPAKGIVEGGGDFFQVLHADKVSTTFCLGTLDIKGAQSTYFALIVRDLLKYHILTGKDRGSLDPAQILITLNDQIIKRKVSLPGSFMSLTICRIEKNNDDILISSAGGEAFFIHHHGTIQEHHSPLPGLGYKPHVQYQNRIFPFPSGSHLALVSPDLCADEKVRLRFETALSRSLKEKSSLEAQAEEVLAQVFGADPMTVDATVIILLRK